MGLPPANDALTFTGDHYRPAASEACNPGCEARLRGRFGGGRGLDGEVGGTRDGLVGQKVNYVDLEGVAAGRERRQGQVALDGNLFAGLLELLGGFVLFPDLLVVSDDAIGDGDVCFVGFGVEVQVIELQENTYAVRGGKFGVDARTHFVRPQNKWALANLRRGDRADLVGEYK